ncbi:MAG: ABC transporter substrate-binding protein [Nitrospinota bacterium]
MWKRSSRLLSRTIAAALILAVAVTFLPVPAAEAAKARARLAVFPLGFMRMTSEWMTDAGVWKKYGAKHDVDFKIAYPRDDFAAFAGRSADFAAFAAFEIARVRSEEGWKALMFGKDQAGLVEAYVRADSPYQSIKDLKGKKFAIPGWATAAALLYQVMIKKFYNLDLKKDFQIVASSFPLVPQLLSRGDVEGGSTIEPLTLRQMHQKKFRVISRGTYAEEWEKHTGHYGLAVTLWTAWEDYLQKNAKAARALLEAWTEGLVHANTNTGQWIRQYKRFVKKDGTEAEFDFFTNWVKEHKPMFKDAYLTKKYVEGENEFVREAAKLGLLGKTKEKEIQAMWKIISK